MSDKKKVEYLGQVPKVKVGKGEKSVSFHMTPPQAKELGYKLLSAALHAERADKNQSNSRSELKPINQVMVTGHLGSGQVTVLGRLVKNSKKST